MQTINPSNGGVLLEAIPPVPGSEPDDFHRPRVGYVIKVGGGVPWLKPRQVVVYDPRRATFFFTDRALVVQQDIVAVIDGVLRAECPNGCHAKGGACTDCPNEKEEPVYPEGKPLR